MRLFPLKTERSSSGLIEFPNISQAVLAIMKCNHLPIEGKGEIVLCLSVQFKREKKRNANANDTWPYTQFVAYGQWFIKWKSYTKFSQQKIRETYPKIIEVVKFQKAILHGPLIFCLLKKQKKKLKEKHTKSSNMPTPTATITTTKTTTTTLPNHSPSSPSIYLPPSTIPIPFRFTTSTRRAKLFGVKSGKLFSSVALKILIW